MAFKIKQGDTRPAYVADLLDDFGLPGEAPLDLTSATTVTFKMRQQGSSGAPKISRAATVVDAANGRVRHDWQAGDLDTTGTFEVEFQIDWSDGGIETIPNDAANNPTIEVGDDLD